MVGGAVATASARGAPRVRPAQELAALTRSHRVFSSPHSRSWVKTINAQRPITGEQTILPVVGQATGRDGTRWIRVMLPGRPNGARGWITQRGTVLTMTSWHIVVRTSSHRVLVYRHGRVTRSFTAIVGKPSTPTPQGQFFVEESVALPSTAAGAPFALALSARSNVLQEFDGGPGQIAIHGLENLGGTLGTAESHGCIRLGLQSITWLITRIAPGTPVTITS
jgi:lipoprotein-anchoring transpeptidase ErfK/SrfK